MILFDSIKEIAPPFKSVSFSMKLQFLYKEIDYSRKLKAPPKLALFLIKLHLVRFKFKEISERIAPPF